MAKFKCKMCGAPLDVSEGQTVVTCAFCQSKQTVANADDERKENLFNRANSLRASCDFDKAILSYQSILSIFPNEPEAHWGLCLCKYGIEYVDDPFTHKKIPTIHRMSFDSILKDSDYLAAVSFADVVAKEEYQDEAKQITNIQKNILSISQKEEPFDIFICYKETSDAGKRTPDSVLAQEIYSNLVDKGYKVFFSRITLENKLGTMYEPYIFAALNSAKIMLAIGTKKEYFEAVWVKNEWARFIDLMKTRPDHYLIPCYKDMDAYEMPEQFLAFQGQDMSKLGFMQDLLRGIDKIMGRSEAPIAHTEATIIQTDVNVPALLKRAEILISDANYEKADELLERVLDNDPTNSQAYLLKLLIELKFTSFEQLKTLDDTIETNGNFKKAYDFGDQEEKARLSSINEFIRNRNEEERLNGLYNSALDLKNAKNYAEAEAVFSSISGYKDASKQALECLNLGKEDIYVKATELKNSEQYETAIDSFEKIKDYKDSEYQISECNELLVKAKYAKAIALKESGSFDEAIAIFMDILKFQDADAQVDECEKLKTEAKKEAIYVTCLFDREINPYFDMQALKKACEKLATIPGYKDSDQLLVKYEGIIKDYETELAKKKEEQARAKAIKAKKVKKISIISGTSSLVLTGVLLLTFLFIIPNGRQNNIRNLIDSGNYDEALSAIEENGNYGDTKNLESMCKAGMAFKSLDYETGIDYIYNVGGSIDVSYDNNGGNSSKGNETIKRSKGYIDNNAEKNGYDFHGWVLTNYSIDSKSHYASIDLKAQYSVVTYNIDYVLDGGSIDGQKPETYTTEESISIPNPTKQGYTFLGWTALDIVTPTVDYVLPLGSTGNKTYTANWKANEYTIYLNPNGGSVSKQEIKVVYDSPYTLPTPSWTGYAFRGWFDSSKKQYIDGIYLTPSDLYLNASWGVIDYSITYNLNGGTNNDRNPSSYKIIDSDIILQDPSRTGYTFTGWTSSQINTPTKGVMISSGSTGDLVFTANWRANIYNVTIDLNGGESDRTSYSFVYDSYYYIDSPTRAGYSFRNFTYNDVNFMSSGTWKIARDITITANWTPNTNTAYTINYLTENLDGNGYTKVYSETKYGTSDSLVDATPKAFEGFYPTESYKIFRIAADGSTIVDFYYSRNTYTISFVSNGGSSIENKTLKYEQQIPSDLKPIRDGYTFDGWYIDEKQITLFDKMPANNQTVYACYAEETKASFFEYTSSENKLTITKGIGLSGSVTVPKYIGGKLVTSIGDNAFDGCSSITDITLSDSIGELGEAAFKGCTSLARIDGTSNLSIIKDSTFEGCSALAYFPDLSNVTSIGNKAFSGCSSLSTITISDTLTSIGNYAFENCVMLLQTPDLTNVASIGDYAFSGCSLLTEIKSLDGCASFGEGILTACENIAKISLSFRENIEQFYVSSLFSGSSDPDKYYEVTGENGNTRYVPKRLTEIEFDTTGKTPDYFLYGLSSITKVTDKSALATTVGKHAFDGCASLADYQVESSDVSLIDEYAFNGCSALATLPVFSLIEIRQYAFAHCSSLSNTPDLTNVTSIGDYAFSGCSSLAEIKSLDGCALLGEGILVGCVNIVKISLSFKENVEQFYLSSLFGKNADSTKYYEVSGRNDKTYNIPNSLKEIEFDAAGKTPDYFLYGLKSITKVTDKSASATTIGKHSFDGCTSLTDYKVENSNVSVVDESAFEDCSALTVLPLFNLRVIKYGTFCGCYSLLNTPDLTNVTSIESYAFSGCSSLKTVTFGNELTSIGDSVFYGCTSLAEVLSLNGCSTLGKDIFSKCESIRKITISFKENIEKFSVSSLFGNATDSTKYYEVTENGLIYKIPNSLKEIEFDTTGKTPDYFLHGLSSITKVTDKSASATTIGKHSFDGCSSLIDYQVENGNVSLVDQFAFNDCKTLATLPAFDLSEIKEYGFAGCSSISNISGLANVTSIGNYAFYGCSSLSGISGLTKVISIGIHSFDGCSSLNTIAIGKTLTSIGEYAFSNCSMLLHTPDLTNVNSIGDYAFSGCSLLTEIKSLDGCASFGNGVLDDCESIAKITISFSKNQEQFYVSSLFENATDSTKYYEVVTNGRTYKVPNSLKEIEFDTTGKTPDYFLHGLSSITKVTDKSASATAIGKHSFDGCTGLTDYKVENNNITLVDEYAFNGCGDLTTLPAFDLSEIKQYGFAGCSSLSDMSGFTNVTYIGNHAFAGCSSLLNTPNLANVDYLGDYAFANCPLIKSIKVPNATYMGLNSLYGCSSLTELEIPFVGTNIDSLEAFGVIFGSNNYDNAYSVSQLSKTYYIPNGLTKLTINGVKIFAKSCQNLTSLTTLIVSDSVETIGEYAFGGMTSLGKLSIPFVASNGYGLGYFFGYYSGDKLPAGMSNTYTYWHGSGYPYIHYYVPASLKEVSVTVSTSIPSNAFYGMAKVEKIALRGDIAKIGDHAFYNCVNLKMLNSSTPGEANIPNGITDIPEYAFYKCTSIERFALSSGVASIGDYAFSGCSLVSRFNSTSEATMAIPESCGSIGTEAFKGMGLIANAVVGDSVESIGSGAFEGFTSLESLSIPFVGQSENASSYSSRVFGFVFGGIGYTQYSGKQSNKTSTHENTYQNSCNNGTTYEWCYYIPASLKTVSVTRADSIPADAFYNCDCIEEVTIPASCSSLGSHAFYGCSSLKRINSEKDGTLNIPSTVESIPNYAFCGCSSIGEIALGEVASIGSYAFSGCSLVSRFNSTSEATMAIPESCGSIGTEAFKGMGLIANAVVGDSVESIGSGAFEGFTSLESLSIPFVGQSENASSYSSRVFGFVFGGIGYTQYSGKQSNKTSTHENTYQNSCNNGTTYEWCYYIPASLKTVSVTRADSIPADAFYNCDCIEEVTIPSTCASIGGYSFYGCTSLKRLNSSTDGEFNIPSSVSAVESHAFYNCQLVESVTLSENVTSIGSYAFAGCSLLSKFNSGNQCELVVPASCGSIGSYAFKGMALVTNVTIPDSVASIGTGAFNGFNSLENITLPFVGGSDGAVGRASVLGYIFGYTSHSKDSGGDWKKEPDYGFVNTQFSSESGATWQYTCYDADYYSSGSSHYYYLKSYYYYIPSSLRNVAVTMDTTIPAAAFNGCSMLESVSIPGNTVSVGEAAFQNCTSLKRVNSGTDGEFNIPEAVARIDRYAFYNCSLAETISTKPISVKIGDYAFAKCSSVSKIILGDGVTEIGDYAFAYCSLVDKFNSDVSAHFDIPKECQIIGDYAFLGMALITSVVVPDSVASIGVAAFDGFNSLENLTLPFVGGFDGAIGHASVLGYVFGYGTYGTNSGEQKTEPIFDFVNKEVGSRPGLTWQYSCYDYKYGSRGYYLHSYYYGIPSSLKNVTVTLDTTIPTAAFNGCSMLENIHLVYCIDSIGDYAFQNCTAKVDYLINPSRSGAWDGKLVATAYHGGTGTESDPYQIFSPKEFIYFLNQIRSGETYYGIYFKLTSNINLGGFAIDSTSLTEETSFKGILDGTSHRVFNFTIKSTENTYNGLFGYMGGTIKNIGFQTSMNITTTKTSDVYTGLVIGNLSGTLENVYAFGSLTTTSLRTSYIGGMVGYSVGSIINSYSNVNVTSTSTNLKCYAGGLAGYNDGFITGSFAYGNVSAKGYAEVYSFASGLVSMEGSNSNVASSFRCKEQVITKFGSLSTSYNEIGTVASLNEIISYCKTNWDGNVWSFKKTLPSF